MDTPIKHLAIIPDGNRRWAKEHNQPALAGHKRGAEITIELARHARKLGIKTLTFWAFSTENWTRTKDEVEGIIGLASLFFDPYIKEAVRDHVKITHLGRKDRLSESFRNKFIEAEEKTKDFDQFYLNLAFDYGGRDEVIRAINKMKSTDVEEKDFENFLDTAGQPYPNPDLIIRTSGEQRTSGFMIWQAAYAEYIFLDKYFPDMKTNDIDEALAEYESRQRRFGK